MKFECDKCRAKYTIEDERIRNKQLKIKCKKCNNIIVVRWDPSASTSEEPLPSKAPEGRKPALSRPGRSAPASQRPLAQRATPAKEEKGDSSASLASRPLPSRPGRTGELRRPREEVSASSRPQRRPASSPAPDLQRGKSDPALDRLKSSIGQKPSLSPSLKGRLIAFPRTDGLDKEHLDWYYAADSDKQVGPISLVVLKSRIRRGEVLEETPVWNESLEEWVPAFEIPEIKEVFERKRSGLHRPVSTFSAHPPQERESELLAPEVPDEETVAVPPSFFGAPDPAPMEPARAAQEALPEDFDDLITPPRAMAVPKEALSAMESEFFKEASLAMATVPVAAPSMGEAPPVAVQAAPAPLAPLAPMAEAPSMTPLLEDKVLVPEKPLHLRMLLTITVFVLGVGSTIVYFKYLQPASQEQQKVIDNLKEIAKTVETEAEENYKPTGESTQEVKDQLLGADGPEITLDPTNLKARAATPKASGPTTPAPPRKVAGLTSREAALYQKDRKSAVDIKPPPTSTTVEKGSGSLSPAQAMSVLRKNSSAFKACYERTLKRNPKLMSGKLETAVTISSTGRVSSVRISNSADDSLTQCIQSAMRRMRFPPFAGEPVTLSYPIILQGGL